MTMYAFFNGTEYLDNDFQSPHYADITAYIEAVYAGDIEAFRAVHGNPDAWQKVEVDEATVQRILAPVAYTTRCAAQRLDPAWASTRLSEENLT